MVPAPNISPLIKGLFFDKNKIAQLIQNSRKDKPSDFCRRYLKQSAQLNLLDVQLMSLFDLWCSAWMPQCNFYYYLCGDLPRGVFPVWRFCDQRALGSVRAFQALEIFYVQEGNR
jgi:hypothetical protein